MIDFQMVWGWQPALYLFLGGVGAGTFVVAAILYLIDAAKNKKTMFVASIVAIACLAVGLLCLITELSAPFRAFLFWQSFSNFGSWMCLGAWLLLIAIIVFFVDALLLFLSEYPIKKSQTSQATSAQTDAKDGATTAVVSQDRTGITKILSAVGLVLGLGIAIYTGVLLMSAPGIPFWGSKLLPCLFTVSALDTGIAAMTFILRFTRTDEGAHKIHIAFETCVIVLVVLEAIVLALYIKLMLHGGADFSSVSTDTIRIAAATSAQTLVSGELSGWFWIAFVGIGLVLPLLAALASIALGKKQAGTWIAMGGAVCALFGGCVLRFLILFAGAHADLIADAVSRLLY